MGNANDRQLCCASNKQNRDLTKPKKQPRRNRAADENLEWQYSELVLARGRGRASGGALK